MEYGWNIGLTTAVLTVLIIIFAEVMPKSIAAAFPEKISHIVYYPTVIILFILKPFIYLLNLLTTTVIKLLGQDPDDQGKISKAVMRAMVDIGHTFVGMFHSKAMLRWSSNPEKGIHEYADMNPLFVFEFNSIDTVFKQMIQLKKHIAIVLDERGGTEGLISHEDLIETMIGEDIEDELDIGDALIHYQTDTQIICDAKLPLHRLNNVFETDIPEEADNLAGFIINTFNYLPKAGESIIYEDLEFKVLDVNKWRINRVEINKLEDE